MFYYCGMSKKSMSIIMGQEREDRLRLETEYLQLVAEDFENAGDILDMLSKGGALREDEIVLPVRRARGFSIHKHVSCFAKYTHSHNFYEIVYVHKGKCVQFLADGQAGVLGEREVCLLSPGAVHALEPASEGDLVLKLVIPSDVFCEAAQALSGCAAKIAAPDTVSFFTARSGRFTDLLFGLLDETFSAAATKAVAIKHYLSLMLLELMRENDNIDKNFCRRLENYIESDFTGASLSGFAVESGYSARHTGRMVKEKLGKTFSDFAAQLRIARAAELLRQTDSPIESIAAELGYTGASGFYKQFSAHFGLTPGEYRNLTG